jgi:Ser/Thr protein kinase RdoA (MazF antagonist)
VGRRQSPTGSAGDRRTSPRPLQGLQRPPALPLKPLQERGQNRGRMQGRLHPRAQRQRRLLARSLRSWQAWQRSRHQRSSDRRCVQSRILK